VIEQKLAAAQERPIGILERELFFFGVFGARERSGEFLQFRV